MSPRSLIAFSPVNRRLIFILVCCHLVWACAIVGFWSIGSLLPVHWPYLSGLFALVQLYAASQLILPALLLHPEDRSRSFYIVWGGFLALLVWIFNLFVPDGPWQPIAAAFKSALLLLVAIIVGAALARYIKRLWEVALVCVVMTMADFVSWLAGPTAGFVTELKRYYTTFEGPPPFVDMILVKIAMPGKAYLSPVFGVSDWVMVVFFAIVARHFEINDNVFGIAGERLARAGVLGCYLPVSVVALMLALGLSQVTGMFVPALPVIALTMLCWYGVRHILTAGKQSKNSKEQE